MRNPVLEFSQISRCLLCHDAPCTKVCPRVDPARILRAIRFENDLGAAMLLPDDDICSTCGSVCVSVCPTKTQIPEILSVLREHATQMEEAPGAESVDLSCEICGVPLENPFLLSSSVVASNYEMCARAFEMGWAGVAYKTICLMEIHETSPRFSAM